MVPPPDGNYPLPNIHIFTDKEIFVFYRSNPRVYHTGIIDHPVLFQATYRSEMYSTNAGYPVADVPLYDINAVDRQTIYPCSFWQSDQFGHHITAGHFIANGLYHRQDLIPFTLFWASEKGLFEI